jgi:hypothetical protein
MLAVHKSAVDKQFDGYHDDEYVSYAELDVNGIEDHDRYVDQEFPQGRDPALVQSPDQLMKHHLLHRFIFL